MMKYIFLVAVTSVNFFCSIAYSSSQGDVDIDSKLKGSASLQSQLETIPLAPYEKCEPAAIWRSIQRDLKAYGGQNGNETFQTLKEKVINQVKDRIAGHQKISEAEQRFESLLEAVGKQRQFIAKKTGTEVPERFGQLRLTDVQGMLNFFFTTVYTDLYPQLDVSARRLFLQEFRKLSGGKGETPKWVVTSSSRYRLRYLEPVEKISLEYQYHLSHLGFQGKLSPEESKAFLDHTIYYEHLLPRYRPNPNRRLVEFELQLKVKDSFVTATRIYSVVQTPPNGVITMESFDNFWASSLIYIVHAHVSDIASLRAMARSAWAQAVYWNKDKESLDDLKAHVARFHYYMSHAMSFVRGSASVSEFMIEGVYRAHGFKSTLNTWLSMDQAALAQPSLEEFVEQYRKDVTLSTSP